MKLFEAEYQEKKKKEKVVKEEKAIFKCEICEKITSVIFKTAKFGNLCGKCYTKKI